MAETTKEMRGRNHTELQNLKIMACRLSEGIEAMEKAIPTKIAQDKCSLSALAVKEAIEYLSRIRYCDL